MKSPAMTAIIELSKTAPAEISLISFISGCCSGVTWSHIRSMAVLIASVTHTPPTKMVAMAHSVNESDTNKPTTMTHTVARRCMRELGSPNSNLMPRPAYAKVCCSLRGENVCCLTLLAIVYRIDYYQPPLAPPPPVIPPPKPPPMPPPKPPLPLPMAAPVTIMGMM